MPLRETSVSWDSGKPVVTFPIPGVPGATGVATLDAKYMVERVVVTNGSATTEFTYSGYKDWNNPLNKIGVLYAGKMTERRNGAVVRDLTTDVTETGNVYVVAPVPASVKAAMKVTGQIPTGVFAKTEPPANKSAPTPRMGAHPDLTGSWVYTDWIGNYMTGGGRRCGPTVGQCTRSTNQTEDFELYSPSRFGNLPSNLQAAALGQNSAARHVDEQVRPGDDLPTAGSPARGPAATHLPDGSGRDLYLSGRRCRRRIRRVSGDLDR
jgi:hypothetical protein